MMIGIDDTHETLMMAGEQLPLFLKFL